METILSYILWSPDPNMFVIPGIDHPVRWYGLLFALGFIFSQQVMFYIFRKEGHNEKDIEKLTLYMLVAVVVGARLGHCLFYDPGYFLSHPLEIIKVWKGGLASHGGALGILIAVYLFSKKYPQYPMIWMLDRLVIVAALCGLMIRTGNFFNSEMEGTLTHSDFGVVYAGYTEDFLHYSDDVDEVEFVKGGEMRSTEPGVHPVTAKITYKEGVSLGERERFLIEGNLRAELLSRQEVREHIDFGQDQPLAYKMYKRGGRETVEIYGLGYARHAAQLYEAAYCALLMLLAFWIWSKKRWSLPEGFNFALFMILLWALRFLDEFFKMNQEAFEDDLVLNMGQLLSIPLSLSGVVMMVYFFKKSRTTMAGEPRSVA